MNTDGGYVSEYLARLADGEPPVRSRPPSTPPSSTAAPAPAGAQPPTPAPAPAEPPAPAAPDARAAAPAASPLTPDPVALRASRAAPPSAPPRPLSTNGRRAAASGARPRATVAPPAPTPPAPRRAATARAAAVPPRAAPAAEPPAPRPAATSPHARNRAAVERTLARSGFSDGFIRELTDTALAHTLALAPRIGLVPAVRAALAQRIPPSRPLPASGCSIVIVGAGGSGKTTCCAALLGAYRSHSTLPARFATLVRAELETELRLMMSPQMLEPQPADSPRARRELRSAGSDGVVVIDTPRLSPSESGGIRELGRLLGELEPDRIVVALPVTLGAVAAEQLLASLEPIGPAALALTHADETDQLGVGIELACRFGLAPELMVEHAPAGGWRLTRLDPAELAARVLR